jgi:hypothetical protein
MKGGKGRFWILSASLIALVYMIFLPRPMGGELFILPAWALSNEAVPTVRNEKSDPGEIIGFRLGSKLGYISPEGRLLFAEHIDYNASLHDKYFLNYSALARNLVTRGNGGEFIGNLGISGYPVILKDKLFIVSIDGSGLSEWTLNGDLLWERRFDTLITTAAAGDSTSLVGLLNGSVHLVDEKGLDIFRTSPPGSTYPVTLQVGISQDSRYFAVISGVGPQKLSIFEKVKETYRLVSSLQLKSDYRRNIVSQCLRTPPLFIYEQPRGVGIYNFSTKTHTELIVPGSVRALSETPFKGLLFTVTEGDETFLGTSFLPAGREVLHFEMEKDKSFFFRQTESYILIGLGTKIFRIDYKVG